MEKPGEDQFRRTTVCSAKSAELLVGVDNPKYGNKLWIVLFTEKVIEHVGITSVSRINFVNDLRNEGIS